jgi:hypothetical protein
LRAKLRGDWNCTFPKQPGLRVNPTQIKTKILFLRGNPFLRGKLRGFGCSYEDLEQKHFNDTLSFCPSADEAVPTGRKKIMRKNKQTNQNRTEKRRHANALSRRPRSTQTSTTGKLSWRGYYGQKPTIVRNPMPNMWYITVKGEDYGFLANTGALFNGQRYKMNSYNPSLTSTLPLAPFNEYAAFSNLYRVINFRCTTRWSALETFPQAVVTGPSTTDIGANNSLILEFSTNQYWKKKFISAKTGMDRTIMHTSINLPTYFGSNQYMFDPNTAANPSAQPTTLLYYNFGTFATNNVISGTEYFNSLELDVVFFKKDQFYS